MWPLLPGMSWEGQEVLSTWLGYASICAWLFAQMPQVIENHRNKSVEAIALPFLISWFFGDFTNLIGCVLTHQLPFQTYLATYFVLVDAALMGQFIHYSRSNPTTTIPPLSIDYPYAQAPHIHHHHHHPHHHQRDSNSTVRRSQSQTFHRSSSHKHSGSRRQAAAAAAAAVAAARSSGGVVRGGEEDSRSGNEGGGDDHMTTSWMSESSTATTPAKSIRRHHTSGLANELGITRSNSTTPTQSSSKTPISTSTTTPLNTSQTLVVAPSPATSTSTTTTSPSASPSTSIVLEPRGRSLTRQYYLSQPSGQPIPHHHHHHNTFPAPNLETISGSPASGSPGPLMRSFRDLEIKGGSEIFGPDRSRDLDGDAEEEDGRGGQQSGTRRRNDLPINALPQHTTTTTTTRGRQLSHGQGRALNSSTSRSRPPPISRRTSSMLLLSVGAWFTFSTFGKRSATSFRETAAVREVQTDSPRAWAVDEPRVRWADFSNSPSALLSSNKKTKRQSFPLNVSLTPVDLTKPSTTTTKPSMTVDRGIDVVIEPLKKVRDWERFIGRTSAWLCTTLYLTSRLPQIWQNFRRRSVEGLSIMLFVMAFIGNSLYVASILLNPMATESVGYLLESTPYLLGSGGTLCFDVTIVLQSWLYSESRRRRKTGTRRSLLRGESSFRRIGAGAGLGGGVGREEEEGLLGTTDEEEEEAQHHRRGRLSGSQSRKPRSTSRRPSSSVSKDGTTPRVKRTRSAGSRSGFLPGDDALDDVGTEGIRMSRSISSRRSTSSKNASPAASPASSKHYTSTPSTRADDEHVFGDDADGEAEGTGLAGLILNRQSSRAERGILEDFDFDFDRRRSISNSTSSIVNQAQNTTNDDLDPMKPYTNLTQPHQHQHQHQHPHPPSSASSRSRSRTTSFDPTLDFLGDVEEAGESCLTIRK